MGGDYVEEKIEATLVSVTQKNNDHLQQTRLRHRDNFCPSKVPRSGGLAPRLVAGRCPELCDALSRL
jgi:hypothetical protein